MGPVVRYLGPEVPAETLLWQDPLPAVDARARSTPRTSPRSRARSSPRGCRCPSWCPPRGRRPRRFRGSDKRGGANGARIRLEPQSGWEVNDPDQLATVLRTLEGIQEAFNAAQAGGKQVSLADLIVLAGGAAVEQAAKDAGVDVEVPFTPGRADASQEQTDVGVVRRARADRRRVPQLPRQGQPAAGRVPADRPGEPADPERARDDRPRRRPARAGRELPAVAARRLHRDPRVADQRLLRQPARPGHDVDSRRRRTRTRSRAATPPPARSSGPAAGSTWSSARTPSCARSPRSTRATTRRRSSCTTSSRRGSR